MSAAKVSEARTPAELRRSIASIRKRQAQLQAQWRECYARMERLNTERAEVSGRAALLEDALTAVVNPSPGSTPAA
jgi:uncharacterized protein YlxW (UPF0749 family)